LDIREDEYNWNIIIRIFWEKVTNGDLLTRLKRKKKKKTKKIRTAKITSLTAKISTEL